MDVNDFDTYHGDYTYDDDFAFWTLTLGIADFDSSDTLPTSP